MRAAALGMLADVAVVLAFVVIGRANHHSGETLAGVASTAWPFLAGLIVWLATVGLGQLLRVVSGQGTEPAFIAVSAAFLGLFLLGWRLIVALLRRARAAR